MEAANKAVLEAMEAFQKAGQKAGEMAMSQAIIGRYVQGAAADDATKFVTEAVVAAKKVTEKPVDTTFVFKLKGDAAKAASLKDLCATASAALAKKDKEAEKATRSMLTIIREIGDQGGVAAALNLVANACIVTGQGRDAVQAAKQALAISKELDGPGLFPVLNTLVAANFVKTDVDEALRAAKEFKKKSGKSEALCTIANISLAAGDPSSAIKAAEEALAAAGGDKEAALAAQCAIFSVHKVMGKPMSALKAAKVALDAAKGLGKKGAEASATLLMGMAAPASKESLQAAKDAAAAFKALGDKSGEGSAMISLAYAYLMQAQKSTSDAVEAAKEALALAKGTDKSLEAFAGSTLALAYMMKQDPQESEKAAQDALATFKEIRDGVGEAYTTNLLTEAKYCGLQSCAAKLLYDEHQVAHIEVSELATQESLEAVVASLHNWSGVKERLIRTITLHIDGTPGPARLQSYAMSSGAFLLGLRSTGMTMTGAISGTIAGPSWGLVLAADYRVATADTQFVCPVQCEMECMKQLLGPSVTAHLCMTHGSLSAMAMMEMGLLHQIQPSKDAASRSASDFARRVATFPGIGSRQTMSLMTPGVEMYAMTHFQK